MVILCGGSGSRLWPLSRQGLPKQFLRLTNEFTMLQNTVFRVLKLSEKSNTECEIVIICNEIHQCIVETQLKEINVQATILLEPIGRDSAAAICIASMLDSDVENAGSFIFPCDHVFDEEKLVQVCFDAIPYMNDYIVTFGIKPSRIETGYGYIQVGQETSLSDSKEPFVIETPMGYETVEFVEKPKYETAKSYIASGNYMWNAGIFAFKNQNMLECFYVYQNDILNACYQTLEHTNFQHNTTSILSVNYFSKCPSISIDYGIMQNMTKHPEEITGVTLLYDGYWSDIGSFSSLYDEMLIPSSESNVISENVYVIDTSNCLVNSNRLVCCIGVEQLCIVDTDDALLICHKDKTQMVKDMVKKLKDENREELIEHTTMFLSWGYLKRIQTGQGFQICQVTLYPREKTNAKTQQYGSKHWVVVSGKANMHVDDLVFPLIKNEHVVISDGKKYFIENTGKGLLEIIETQIF